MSISYPSTTATWPGRGVIQIYDVDDTRIAMFSCEFLERGQVLEWDYITSACQAVVNEAGRVAKLDGNGPTPSTPAHGSYRYLRNDLPAEPATFREGPRFHHKRRGPAPGETDSGTMSNSSRSTVQQSQFRFRVAMRDFSCLVSDFEDCVGAHILPQSRPEYYGEVLGFVPDYLFHVSYGLYLRADIHHAFDRGEWGLYPKPAEPQTLLIHVFNSRDLKQYHGKELKQERFRIREHGDLPHPSLLAFHYRQCLMKHVRTFSYFGSAP